MAHEIDFVALMEAEKQKGKQNHEQKETTKRQPHKHGPSNACINQPSSSPQVPWSQLWLTGLPITLDAAKHCISKDPKYVYYLKTFLTPSQQYDLSRWLQRLPDATTEGQLGHWNTMKYSKRRVAMFHSPLPDPLFLIASTMVTMGVFERPPNHVLINSYSQGQGILPHTDGPLYQPRTATISIGGSDVIFKLAKRLTADEIGVQNSSTALEVVLDGNGSLVVFCEDAYTNFVHSIDDQVMEERVSDCCCNAKVGTTIVRGDRISLTFRVKLE